MQRFSFLLLFCPNYVPIENGCPIVLAYAAILNFDSQLCPLRKLTFHDESSSFGTKRDIFFNRGRQMLKPIVEIILKN